MVRVPGGVVGRERVRPDQVVEGVLPWESCGTRVFCSNRITTGITLQVLGRVDELQACACPTQPTNEAGSRDMAKVPMNLPELCLDVIGHLVPSRPLLGLTVANVRVQTLSSLVPTIAGIRRLLRQFPVSWLSVQDNRVR